MSTRIEEVVETVAEAFVLADMGEADACDDVLAAVKTLLAEADVPLKLRQVAEGLAELLEQLKTAEAGTTARAAQTIETAIRELQDQAKSSADNQDLVTSEDLDGALAQFEQFPAAGEPAAAPEPELVPLADIQARLSTVAVTDLAELAQLHESVTSYLETTDAPSPDRKSVQQILASLETIILSDAADPTAELEALRALAANLTAGESAVAEAPPLPTANAALPAAVDENMLADFLNRQPAVLDELEATLLAKPLGADATAIVRRTLHTMKGECGLLGLQDVADLCHLAEEVLESRQLDVLVEPLLEVKDWLSRQVAACQGKCQPPPPADTLAIHHIGPAQPLEETHDMPTFEATDDMFAGADESLLQDFIAESLEHLEASDQHLLQLETQPRNRDLLDAVFRGFHTIKGVAGFLGLTQIQSLAHEAENLLDTLRRGDLTVNPGVLQTIFLAVDALKVMIKTGTFPDGPPALATLVKRIRQAKRGRHEAQAPPQPAPATAEAQPSTETRTVQLRETLKVDAERLDKLIDTVGELVIAESMVHQSLAPLPGLQEQKRHQNNMSKITRELQEICMSLRMVPVRPTFQKMARVVHDLAQKEGKAIRFITAGDDTELDKTVVDQVGDPLLHMVRNAVDHGIEDSPVDRRAAGKQDEATIELRAFHQGGSIYIEIRDDGRGLDRDAILDKALAQGLIDTKSDLSERDLYMLIFEPGFSTRQQATDISGRGVGMDVVKRNIEGLRGRVDVQTQKGKGTTFTIKLPLTLAIIEGMLVRVGDERYAIPTVSILRTVSLDDDRLASAMERGRMLNVGNELLPLFYLHDLFMTETTGTAEGNLAVILENEGERFAVVVDELLGQEQIVLKSLGSAMQGIPGLAGGAIMPDGRVGLIVDVAGLRRLARQPRQPQLAATA